jgi:hypothetical protein
VCFLRPRQFQEKYWHVVFLVFLNIAAGDFHALLAELIPPPEGEAKLTATMVLTAPSHTLLRVSWARTRPASFLLTHGRVKSWTMPDPAHTGGAG